MVIWLEYFHIPGIEMAPGQAKCHLCSTEPKVMNEYHYVTGWKHSADHSFCPRLLDSSVRMMFCLEQVSYDFRTPYQLLFLIKQ